MKKSSIITIILIIVFALIAGVVAFNYLISYKTNVYVFSDDYEAGTQITADMFSAVPTDVKIVEQINNSNSTVHYMLKDEANEAIQNGDYLKFNTYKGMPFLSNSTVASGGNNVEMRLSPDMVAVTIAADNVSGVTPEMSYDSRVNVFISYQKDDQTITEMLLENVRVIDVQSVISEESEDTVSKSLNAVTLELTPENAMKIKNAEVYAEIDFALVKTGQYKENSNLAPIISDLVPDEGAGKSTDQKPEAQVE